MHDSRGTALATGLRDFPEFVGSMIVKELRQGMRARRFVVPFVLVHFAMFWALSADLAAIESGPGRARYFDIGLSGQAAFWTVMITTLIAVIPLGGIGMLQKEASGSNTELLLLTRLTRWKVVCGQWLVLCAQGSLILLATLPYLLVRYLLAGGMYVLGTAAAVVAVLLVHGTANALAIGISGYREMLFRILVGIFAALAYVFTVGFNLAGAAYFLEMIGSDSEPATFGGLLLSLLVTSAYFSVLFLQIGRTRICLFENPHEPPQSRGVVTLVIVSPFFIGFFALATAGVGAILLTLLLVWAAYSIDRTEPMAVERRAQTKVDAPATSV